MLSDILLNIKIEDGYLLKILNDNKYQIHHKNNNGYIEFNTIQSLLKYIMQIDSIFEITDINKDILKK